jgi:hypothetical protein
MAIPKNFKKNIDITRQPVGTEQRQKILDGIADKQPYLPRGVGYEDMDREFIKFVKTSLETTIQGEKVPVYIVSTQRWYEFYTTWENNDEFRNLKLPFILITRRPEVQKGTQQNNLYNIPGVPTWTYVKVPTSDGTRQGYDIYQIPQPISVDITYDIRFFCKGIRQLNTLNTKIQRTFSARQSYINVNGHPMPLILDTITDESQMDNLEQRRFYVQEYEIKLMGYILVEEDFKILPAIDRVILLKENNTGLNGEV